MRHGFDETFIRVVCDDEYIDDALTYIVSIHLTVFEFRIKKHFKVSYALKALWTRIRKFDNELIFRFVSLSKHCG